MKLQTILLAMATTFSASAANPLLEKQWSTPHQTPPFAQIKVEHFVPAIKEQIAQSRQRINMIVMQRSVPMFENTIVALENAQKDLGRTLSVFYNLNSTETNDSLQAIALEITPLLTDFSNDISLNEALFNRVSQVWDRRAEREFTKEESLLLENTYKGFVRSGANLSAQDKEQYRRITSSLAELSVRFDQNELAAINDFSIHLTRKSDLAGLPAMSIEAASMAASEAGQKGYIVTLHAPSFAPFMKYAKSRALREQLWRAKMTLCATDAPTDNREIVRQTANLRLEMANLLGYPTYADYALEERMASSASRVNLFLAELLDKTIDYAKADLDVIESYARSKGFPKDDTFMPWDFAYWNEKYSTAKFKVNDQMTRSYFRLEDVEKALFLLADKLYGLTFTENAEIPVYHPDVLAYEVRDASGEMLSVLYCDYFPRASKNSGAWMNTFREVYKDENGVDVRPIVMLVNNFTKPTSSTPSLLSFDEFQTMLHEFGHGLHGILARGTYSSLTGTNVKRDFVELPSQIMENWAYEKEFLDLFASHYKTGKPMPADLITKLLSAKNHMAAYVNVNQVKYAMTDMAWHSIAKPVEGSVGDFERAATLRAQLLPSVDGAMMSPSFGHIFAGGYAAGYYSYKWAELLEANAYKRFRDAGVFDRQTASRFRRLLESGGTDDSMKLFVDFNGEEPTIEPMIEKMGLQTTATAR